MGLLSGMCNPVPDGGGAPEGSGASRAVGEHPGHGRSPGLRVIAPGALPGPETASPDLRRQLHGWQNVPVRRAVLVRTCWPCMQVAGSGRYFRVQWFCTLARRLQLRGQRRHGLHGAGDRSTPECRTGFPLQARCRRPVPCCIDALSLKTPAVPGCLLKHPGNGLRNPGRPWGCAGVLRHLAPPALREPLTGGIIGRIGDGAPVGDTRCSVKTLFMR